MPISLPPRRPDAKAAQESFLLKSVLIASALLMAGLLVVTEEFYFSSPAQSLSEAEAALRLTVR